MMTSRICQNLVTGMTGSITLTYAVLLMAVTALDDPFVETAGPRQNMWVTWANRTNTSSFCLSLTAVSDPFRTCLIGIPLLEPEKFVGFISNVSLANSTILQKAGEKANASDDWCHGNQTACQRVEGYDKSNWCGGCGLVNIANRIPAWKSLLLIWHLNKTLPWDPQELQLAGSVKGTQNGLCFGFSADIIDTPVKMRCKSPDINSGAICQPLETWTDASGSGDYGISGFYPNAWCGGAVGLEDTGQHKISPEVSLALPEGIFLICGDRAWQGIPKNPLGGPCYLGRLSLLAPSIRLLKAKNQTRSKRALNALPATCDDSVKLLGKAENLLASIFCPGCAAVIANANLHKLACWAAKQANLTSEVLTELMEDIDSNRKAILQNRAAIDFLLLAHGHGCEDFGGMRCFNLSDHSKSIHTKIQDLREHVNKIREESGLGGLSGWLQSLGLGPWLREIVYSALIILAFILILLTILPCLMNCIQRMIAKLLNQAFQANLASLKENGGDVESFVDAWLAEKGHDQLQLVRQ